MKKLPNLILRYIIILITGLGNLFIFYKTFTPLTIKTLSILLSSPASGSTIITSTARIELIPACIAGSAYYLLFLLNLSTPEIKLKKRIKHLLFTFLSLFILNISRIIFLISINQTIYFKSIHLVFWYFLSTIFVAGIWIFSVKFFKIKQIPVYSDLRFLINTIEKT